MSGPSEKATDAASDALSAHETSGWYAGIYSSVDRLADDALAAAHNPSLGLDRSVCIRDVVEFLRGRDTLDARHFADVLAREFAQGGAPKGRG